MSPTLQFVVPVAISLIATGVLVAVAYLRRNIQSRLGSQALTLLTSLAGTLVLAAADEVRTLKSKPGDWTPAAALQVKTRALGDLKVFGADALVKFQDLNGTSPDDINLLLDRLIEQQVEVLRSKAKPPAAI